MKKEELTSLPNIGKTIAKKLKEVGIETADDLRSVGSENAFIRLKTVDEGACVNELMALEGAILGIRWHDMDAGCKAQLKHFYEICKLKG